MKIRRLLLLFILCFSVVSFGMEQGNKLNDPDETIFVPTASGKAYLYLTQDNNQDAVRVVFKQDEKIVGTGLYTLLDGAWRDIFNSRVLNKIKADAEDPKNYAAYDEKVLKGCSIVVDAAGYIDVPSEGGSGTVSAPYVVFKKIYSEAEIIEDPDSERPYHARCYVQGKTYHSSYEEKPGDCWIHKNLIEQIKSVKSTSDRKNGITLGDKGKEEMPPSQDVEAVGSGNQEKLQESNQSQGQQTNGNAGTSTFAWGSFFKFAVPTTAIIGIMYTIYYKWFKAKK